MARVSASARHYAVAVFGLARDGNQLDAWQRELEQLVQLLAVPDAARVLTSPAVSEAERLAAIGQLMPRASDQFRSLLQILISRGRLDLASQILDEFRRLLDEYRGVAVVEVTTAVPLDPAATRLLTQRLATFTGKQVRLESRVDPSIIGGVVARIGDELIDDSVRGRLDRLRRQLKSGAERA
jgi:F-type H+-transporting ATPase subunit delta